MITHLTSRISEREVKPFFKCRLPLAGGFLTKEEVGKDVLYPLTLSFCEESSSIQVDEVISPKVLFKKYFYKTGDNKSLVNHLGKTARLIYHPSQNKILELGCNDFSFLKNFVGKVKTIVGVDPSDISAQNIPEGCILENDFFSLDKSNVIKEKYGEFDLVFSSNNFAHIENILDYTLGIKNLLSSNGQFIGEVHWALTLIERFQFSFIYHEHQYYYTIKSLEYLLNKCGLFLNHVEKIDMHGGSIRFYASKTEKQSNEVKLLKNKEEDSGLYKFETYLAFAEKIEELKTKTRAWFDYKKHIEKKTIYGYGASGQANTLMALLGITKDDLTKIIDDSPVKHGLYTPNNYIKIYSSDSLNDDGIDCIYVLAYTFFDFIKEKNKSFEGQWIHPLS